MKRITENVHRAAVWNFLAEAFRRHAERFPELDPRLEGATRALGLDLQPVRDALARTPCVAEDYDHLFGHTVRGGCPAYEGEYGEPKGFRFAHEIGDVQGFYRAFGLKPSRKAGERADHISVECEFFAFLAVKEACAEELHGEEKRSLCREAAQRFLQRHLGRFGRSFATRLRRQNRSPFFTALGTLLDQAILRDTERLGVEAGPDDLGLREDAGTPDDACIKCGAFDGTPQ
jgi:TorA maturation chaperone TorD